MSNIINNYSTTMVTIFKDVIYNYENNLETIKQTEQELCDILHEIELSTPKDAYHGYLLYKEVRELRLRRRKAKEENELLQEMYDYFKSPQGQQFKNKVQQLQGSSVKLREAQERRTYTPRQRTDLTITDQTCTAHKPFEQMLSDFKKTKVEMRSGKLRK